MKTTKPSLDTQPALCHPLGHVRDNTLGLLEPKVYPWGSWLSQPTQAEAASPGEQGRDLWAVPGPHLSLRSFKSQRTILNGRHRTEHFTGWFCLTLEMTQWDHYCYQLHFKNSSFHPSPLCDKPSQTGPSPVVSRARQPEPPFLTSHAAQALHTSSKNLCRRELSLRVSIHVTACSPSGDPLHSRTGSIHKVDGGDGRREEGECHTAQGNREPEFLPARTCPGIQVNRMYS